MPGDAKRAEIEAIIGRSLLTAEVFATELRKRLTDLSPIGILVEARAILEQFEPILAQAMSDAELAAWVSGTDSVVRILPSLAREALEVSAGLPPTGRVTSLLAGGADEPVVSFPLIERAAESLLERNIVTRTEFDELGREARARAFTVARQDSEDTISTIRDVLAETIDQGASLGEFRARLGERLDGSFLGAAHRENVYRTNVQTAFHQAHDELADDPIVREIFPYQSYDPIDDGRVREDHLALKTLGLNGTSVYRRDDPFWDLFTPPWGYQCRCGVTLLSVETAARRGVVEARTWDRTGIPPANPEHRLQDIPFRPEEGFVGGRVRRLSLFVRLAVAHAPAGGISIGGKQFTGGQFIPGEVLEKATKEEKAAVEGNGESKARPKLKLQGNERQAMAAWVAGASTDIRAKEFSDDITPSIQTFHAALDKFPKHKGIVFRGLTVDADKLNELSSLPKGFVFDFKASTSTSTKEKVSRRFADPEDVFGQGDKSVMFRIGSKTGADISSTNEEQGEVILRRGSRYQVTRITKGDGVDLVVHMEEIATAVRMSVRMAQVHAPKGGVSIGGKQFKGGEFIPGEDLAKATPEEKAKIEGGEAKAEPKQKAANPTQRERNAVADYTTDKFQQINGVLRGQQEATPSEASMIKDIDSFLAKAPKRTGATVRSFQIPADSPLRELLQVGGVISDAAYMSTRAKPSVVDTIAFRDRTAPPNRVVLRVEGQGGVDISELSSNPAEGEVLYPRGSQFEVVQAVHLDNGAILAVVKQVGSAATSRGASDPSNPGIRMSVA